MCADTHSTLGSPNNFGYLRVRTLLKPVELYDLTLARWKPLEGYMEELGTLAELDGHEVGLGRGACVDLEGGHLAALRSPPVLSNEVHGDRHDPGTELRATPEVVTGAVEPEEGLLHDLFCELVVAKVAPREPEEDRPVAFEQRAERRLVAVDVGVHQLFIGGRGAWGTSRHTARSDRGRRGPSFR